MNIKKSIAKLIRDNEMEQAQKAIAHLNLAKIDDPELLLMGAEIYRHAGQNTQAIIWSHKALSKAPSDGAVIANHIKLLMLVKCPDDALKLLEKINRRKITNQSLSLQIAKLQTQMGNYKAARDELQQLLTQWPDNGTAHIELAHNYLIQGEWLEGWRELEWLYKMPHTRSLIPELPIPQWDGTTSEEHILLIADQGYGDSIQYSRYIPMVKQHCNRISLIRSRPLGSLLDTVYGIDHSLVNWSEIRQATSYATLSSLPGCFSTTPETVPPGNHLFTIDDQVSSEWERRLQQVCQKDGLRVGLAWGGRPEYGNHYLRSVPVDLLDRLLEIDGANFISLQVDADDMTPSAVINLTDAFTDFYQTAAMIQQLDLVVTSDTSIAHLAGSLGKPTVVMLSAAPDWRWGLGTSTSPWYDSVRLVRQTKLHQWNSVVEKVQQIVRTAVEADAAFEFDEKLFSSSLD